MKRQFEGAAGGLRDALREGTRLDHQRLDHHPLLAPLVRPGLDLAHYGRVLRTLYWIHAPLDAALRAGLARHCPDTAYRPSPRLEWLADDLAWLGIDIAREANPLADWQGIPLPGAAAVVGALYVVEGSTMGGQVIARQLREALNIEQGRGATLFNGHGPATMARWGDFWTFAETACPAAEMPEAVRAASAVFVALREQFDRAAEHFLITP